MSTTTTTTTTATIPSITITTISSLPIEIHAQILRSLPRFRDVRGAILASRIFHNAWMDSQNSIINAIAREEEAGIQPWEPLVRLYLAKRQQKFEVSADEIKNCRLNLQAITYIFQRIRSAEEEYKLMLSKTSHMRDPLGPPPQPSSPPRKPCPLELDLFIKTYLAMKLIKAHPLNLLTPLFSRITTMDLLRIRQLQGYFYPRESGGSGGDDRGSRLVRREFMARLPRESGVWEGMAERMMDGEPFALWREAQERVRGIEQALKDDLLPWDMGEGAVEIVWGAGGVEGFTAVPSDGGHGGIMGLYRWQ